MCSGSIPRRLGFLLLSTVGSAAWVHQDFSLKGAKVMKVQFSSIEYDVGHLGMPSQVCLLGARLSLETAQ